MTRAPSPAAATAGLPTLAELPTPALVLDRERLERNCAAMAARATALGVRLRPHLKTAKCVEVARLATAGHFGGLTVSTLREAEHFAAAGFRDLVYAVCITPDKLPRAAALVAAGVRLGLLTDDLDVAAALAAFARERRLLLEVFVEVDVGEHRTGVDPEGEALLAIARALHAAPGLTLRGVLAHGGHSYACRSRDELDAVAEEERARAVRAARRLVEAGLPCPEVSIGSTPTAAAARSAAGVTELRPGVYVFGDLFQAALGACRPEDIALSVLATVIGRRPATGGLVIDAGALALSKDRSTAATRADAGYGQVADVDGRPLPGVVVQGVHQEHGEVAGLAPGDLHRFPVGSRVRVLPNHACLTAAAHERYHLVAGRSPQVLDVWDRINGW